MTIISLVLETLGADTKGVGVICPRCGREAERREQFCGACGAFLGWDEGQPADSQVLPKPEPQKEEQREGVQIRLENDVIAVATGSTGSTDFVVKNIGTKVEEFGFSADGPEWLAVEPATASVFPGEETRGSVQAAPPRTPTSTAGTAPFRVTVTSAIHSHLSRSALGRVDVAPYYEFAALLDPSSSRGRGWTRHTITLNNRGNTPLRILLDSTDVADGLRLSLSAVAEVEPGMVTEVPVAVHGRRRWFGRPESKTFAVVAEPPKPLAPVRLAGTRVLVPIFPRWVPVAAAGVLAAVVAAAVVHAATGKRTGAQSSASSHTGGATSKDTSSSSNTPSPSPSPSPSPTPVRVTNVVGEPLSQAKADLRKQGLVPAAQAFYDPSTTPGNVVKTMPAPDTVASPGSRVQVFVDTGTTLFAPLASSASWTARSFVSGIANLQFPGQPTDTNGTAFSASGVTLEDGSTAPATSLETIPPDVMGFALRGAFTLQHPIIAGQVFRAFIGFPQGTTAGKIRYQIITTDAAQNDHIIGRGIHEAGTGQLTPVEVPLTKYAGATNIALRVVAIDSPSQDDVVWVDPRIEEWNAPSRLPLQTASPSPTPSPTGP
jgi:hypothetical protein